MATAPFRVVGNVATLTGIRVAFVTAATAFLLASCGSETPAGQTPGQAAEGVAVSQGEGCDILSAAEVSSVIGAQVVDAIGVGSGCTFNYAGGDDYAATLQRMPAADYGPGGAKPEEYRELPGIGDAAWLGRGYQNSWKAQAKSGDKAVNVAVGGQSATPEMATALLRAALPKA